MLVVTMGAKDEGLSPVTALLRRYKLRPQKRLGQHFLVDEGVLEPIMTAAEPAPDDIVIEVGPGLGILTRRLAAAVARVVAVELDSRLVKALREELADSSNIELVQGDILQLAPQRLVGQYLASARSGRSYKVVANLPYYISSPVLRHFLEAALKPSLMVVMVQKEVGEAIAAAAGKMSLLAVGIQFYSKPSIVGHVPARCFDPPPKVDSVVLRLDVRDRPAVDVPDINSFFELVRCGFRSPRKQLRNSLAQALGMPPGRVSAVLAEAGIEARRRAETLSLEEWKGLGEAFAHLRE
jgi:16S rRNA (adenine1518-N6/adenine1519-N6)-dimethyltransferase